MRAWQDGLNDYVPHPDMILLGSCLRVDSCCLGRTHRHGHNTLDDSETDGRGVQEASTGQHEVSKGPALSAWGKAAVVVLIVPAGAVPGQVSMTVQNSSHADYIG